MPSPPAIAIAVIGMLALGVGLGSAMSEIAASAPLSTILLEYPQHADEAPPAEEPEEEEEAAEVEAPVVAAAPEEAAVPEEIATLPVPEEALELPPEAKKRRGRKRAPGIARTAGRRTERTGSRRSPRGRRRSAAGNQARLADRARRKQLRRAPSAPPPTAPYLSRVLPKKGELLPNYYGVTGGVLANEIALLSGQGPTAETAANCPELHRDRAGHRLGLRRTGGRQRLRLPATKSNRCRPSWKPKELTWRAYVEDMENGGAVGQPWRCRKPTLGGPDTTVPDPGDQYANWRNPVVYFVAIAEGAECEKHDVGFEILTKDLESEEEDAGAVADLPQCLPLRRPTECEPGAPTGARGATQLLKTLVPAIMASPAYEEGGGLIMITSAQAPQAGEHRTRAPAAWRRHTRTCRRAERRRRHPGHRRRPPKPQRSRPTATKYTEESVLETGGGGKVGLLMISPLVEPGKVEETEYANHFTLLKTLETMFGVEPLGYAGEEEVPTLSPELFVEEKADGAGRSERSERREDQPHRQPQQGDAEELPDRRPGEAPRQAGAELGAGQDPDRERDRPPAGRDRR